jgi:hypothetical protein
LGAQVGPHLLEVDEVRRRQHQEHGPPVRESDHGLAEHMARDMGRCGLFLCRIGSRMLEDFVVDVSALKELA